MSPLYARRYTSNTAESVACARKGAEEAGKLVGAVVTYTGPAGFDIEKQVDFIKSAIAENVDGIATTMPDPAAFNDVVKEAMSRGIPVIALERGRTRNGRLAYIGQIRL